MLRTYPETLSEAPVQESRLTRRFPARGALTYRSLSSNSSPTHSATVANCSPVGVCFHGTHELVPGQVIWLRTSSGANGVGSGSNRARPKAQAVAEVRWCKSAAPAANPGQAYTVGARYL
ncbi:MAG: hypothetical protein WBG37_14300 [Desulfobacterales bacterium]